MSGQKCWRWVDRLVVVVRLVLGSTQVLFLSMGSVGKIGSDEGISEAEALRGWRSEAVSGRKQKLQNCGFMLTSGRNGIFDPAWGFGRVLPPVTTTSKCAG
jgi:hypothetical protein